MTFHSSRKLKMTLLEMLIAIGLLSILLTTVLGIYQNMNWLQQEIGNSQKRKFNLLYVQYRLAEVLPLARAKQKEAVGKKPHDFYFYTMDADHNSRFQSLVITYDNGISTPDFSNEVIGKLFVDKENRLCLVTWPAIERESGPHIPMRKEVLLENVEEIGFAFYLAPRTSKETNPIDATVEKLYNAWHLQWPLDGMNPDEVSLPPLMRMLVKVSKEKGESETFLFAFLLPYSEQHIEYRK